MIDEGLEIVRRPHISLSDYVVKRIDRDAAMSVVTKWHYLHRTCPCSMAFALCDSDNNMYGVVTYGVPPSPPLLKGICGEDEMHNVYELNRLWIHPSMPTNSASMLVGRSLRRLDKEIIVSYADTGVGHVGYVYQACNFLYCGTSKESFFDPIIAGFEGKHNATLAYGLTMKEVEEVYGPENVTWVPRSKKHRYIYFNAKGKRKQELMRKLRYKVLPYPKGDSKHAEQESEVCNAERFIEQMSLF